MAKEKETENRSERERFLDCMLKEILSGHASEAIDYWCGWSDRVTVQYREALLQLGSE